LLSFSTTTQYDEISPVEELISRATTTEYAKLNDLNCQVSRIGLGTWSIGGFMWGGTDEHEALETIRTALDYGISIDTAFQITNRSGRRSVSDNL
jgi:hypothetical protein